MEETAYLIAGMPELKGAVNVQVRKQEKEYYIFEINPGISSTIGVRQQLGFNDISWWIEMIEWKKVKQYEDPWVVS